MNYIAFVTVCVTDQDRALAFYESIGFQKSSDRRISRAIEPSPISSKT